MLKIGQKALNFELKDQNGRLHKLQDYRSKWLVIYFYPKDNTPRCTKEACNFRDNIDVLRNMNTEILGISKDSITSHTNFTDRYNLPFPLLSDPKLGMIKEYGAWQKKSMFGKTFFSTSRITYIIDPKGKVSKIYPHVNPATHTKEILTDLKSIQK